jgi:DNA-directed RNA polymerase specialized sigma24 family protein
MRRLPDDTQVMLELFYWEAMSVQEIAGVLDRPANTVKTRMRRGRAQLLAELAALRREEPPHA